MIAYAKMMCDYFEYVNNQESNGQFDKISRRMEEFCMDNKLQVKAIKEVHYLCLQLEKLMNEVSISEEKPKSLFVDVTSFPHPSEDQEKLL